MKILSSFFSLSFFYCNLCFSQPGYHFVINSSGNDTVLNSVYFLSSCGETLIGESSLASIGFIQATPKVIPSISETNIRNQFLLFPNPAGSEITIKAPFNIKRFSVYSSVGSLIADGLKNSNTNSIKINISNYNNGMYFLLIKDDFDRSYRQKFIKQ